MLCATGTAGKKEKVTEEVCVIDTNLGKIAFRFFTAESPKTVASFKSLVQMRFFDGTLFDRVLPGLLIEGGDPDTREQPAAASEIEVPEIEIEENDLQHRRGTVSMTHGREERVSRSEFFISLQEVSYFDGKNTIIGEIISGLDVVQAISQVPRNLKQAPLFPVRVRRVYLETQSFMKEVK